MLGKYAPLKAFLEGQPTERVRLTFGDIEGILGTTLPKSKRYPAWWSNSPSNNTMTQVWLDAGFATEQVDTAGEKLVFRRLKPEAASGLPPPSSGLGLIARLQAKLAGTVRFAEGFDPTEPTGEIWDAER